MSRYSKMDSDTQKKFSDVSNHMRVVMSYLVYEFGYGTRVKQKSDVIPRCIESVFKPINSHKTDTKWTHGDATLTYGLDNHHKAYTTLTIRGVHIGIPDLPARKMAKLIDFYLNNLNK